MQNSQTFHLGFDDNKPWKFSLILHGVILLSFAVGNWIENRKPSVVEFSVIENPTISPTAVAPKIDKIEKPKPVPKEKQAVFGASRKTILSNSDEGETVKLGNTVAKAQDDKKLNADDPDALPIPTDEFLVTAMPKLKSEVRILYPPEAKKKSIQGVVVMDLLIDGSGQVREVTIIEGPGSGLNEAAATAAKGFLFEPARVEKQSVPVRIRYSYRFVLER